MILVQMHYGKCSCISQFLLGTKGKSNETTSPLKVKADERDLKQNILIYIGIMHVWISLNYNSGLEF